MTKTAKQKIIIFLTAYLPLVGGAELAIKAITDRLPQYDFTLITARMRRDLPREEHIGNVLVRRIGFGFSFDKWLLTICGAFVALRLTKNYQLKTENCILWGMMASQGSLAAVILKKLRPDLPFLLTLQEGDPEEYLLHGRMGIMGFFFKRIVRAADRIQTISEYLKGLAIKVGAEAAVIDVVPNGVDLENFRARKRDLVLRDKLDIEEKDRVIVTTSRLVEKNAVDVVIRALAALKTKRPEERFRFLVVGVGPDEAKLKKLARELWVDDLVIWAGLVKYDDLPKYLALADIFVRPSRSEGLGNAFLEAMACEVPVIGTPVGGIPDFLHDRETGLTVAVEGVTDLALKMEQLIFDEALRARIIPAARKLVDEKYGWGGIAAKMAVMLAKLGGV
ncbi:MAG: glycosyltransferase family 4 protein [Candidatus Niyogibacteria bacterium]|nr:glycosyltransferase family 4 protein [Candidatus Niyogibacteria bacterium]